MDNKDTIVNFSFIGIGRVATIVLQALFYLLLAAFLEPETYNTIRVE